MGCLPKQLFCFGKKKSYGGWEKRERMEKMEKTDTFDLAKTAKLPEQAKVKSLYKAIQLLFYFSGEKKELGVTELAEKTGMLKSSVHNILATYEVCGIVERNPKTNKYRLGIRVLELSNQFYHNNDVRHVVRPIMDQVAEILGESVYLAVFHEKEIIYVDGAFPSIAVGRRNMTGIKAPAYCTGIGKALLAYQPEPVIEEIIEDGLKGFTKNTITDGRMLKRELAIIRRQGYAVDNMEHEYGIQCVAVPIFNREGKIVAAYSVSGPSPRFSEERIGQISELLKESAETVKWQLSAD